MKQTTILLSLLLSTAVFAQDKQITFQKIGSTKTVSMSLGDQVTVTLLPMRSYLSEGKRHGLICGYNDSTICLKELHMSKENIAKVNKISRDHSLTRAERKAAILKTLYPDSVYIPYDSITQIDFELFSDKKYLFRCIATTAEWAGIGLPSWITFASLALINRPDAATETTAERNAINIVIPVSAALTAGSYYVMRHGSHKKFNTKKWKLKT